MLYVELDDFLKLRNKLILGNVINVNANPSLILVEDLRISVALIDTYKKTRVIKQLSEIVAFNKSSSLLKVINVPIAANTYDANITVIYRFDTVNFLIDYILRGFKLPYKYDDSLKQYGYDSYSFNENSLTYQGHFICDSSMWQVIGLSADCSKILLCNRTDSTKVRVYNNGVLCLEKSGITNYNDIYRMYLKE